MSRYAPTMMIPRCSILLRKSPVNQVAMHICSRSIFMLFPAIYLVMSAQLDSSIDSATRRDNRFIKNFPANRPGDHITSLKRRVRKVPILDQTMSAH